MILVFIFTSKNYKKMTQTAAVKNSISYVTDAKGSKLAIQFNLKNKIVQDLMEDLLDTIAATERYNDPKTSIAQARKEIYE